MQAEPTVHYAEKYRGEDFATVASHGQLPGALDEHSRAIDEVAEELDQLRRVLGPLTQDVAVDGRGPGGVAVDPSPPASELTRRVRHMTDQLRDIRNAVQSTRAYLDLE